jgi:small GTP-binding protein
MSFKCSQCYDEYNEKNPSKIPKILKCGCTLCFRCLQFSLSKAKKLCPICTSEIKETLEEVRTNIFAYNLKNAIICNICLKEFENNFNSEKSPKVLKCGETLCFECIKNNYINNSIICPICRKQSEEKIDEIPVNKLAIESVQKEILNNIHFFNGDNKDLTQISFDYEFSIGLMGDMNVGKTSITHYFYKGTPLKYSQATVGFEFHYKIMKFKEKNIKIRLWDTAGTEAYRGFAMGLLRGVNAVVIVFSLAVQYSKDFEKDKEEEWKNADENKKEEIAEKIKNETFNGVRSWYRQFSQFNNEKDKIIYLIGNKSDDVEHRVIKKKDALSLANELNLKYFETSAVTGDGINKIFSLLSYDIMNKMENDKLSKNTNTEVNNNIHLTKEGNQEHNANKKRKCCK